MAFTIFAPDSLLRFYMFATYLPRAYLCKSMFCSVGAECQKGTTPEITFKEDPSIYIFNYVMLFCKMYELDVH